MLYCYSICNIANEKLCYNVFKHSYIPTLYGFNDLAYDGKHCSLTHSSNITPLLHMCSGRVYNETNISQPSEVTVT